MSQHYSDPTRESNPTALPDIETFEAHYTDCVKCGALVTATHGELASVSCAECDATNTLKQSGWFYWSCFPGCLPDSDPMGPYATEAQALADAQIESDDDADPQD